MLDCLICFAVCIFSTIIGAISGIGGGVIIKPLLDMTLTGFGTQTISLLSAFAVLSMSLFSIGKNYVQKTSQQALSMKIAVPLAVSSTVGGVVGKLLFNALSQLVQADATVKCVQNAVLFVVMVCVLIFTLRHKSSEMKERSVPEGLLAGLLLGLFAAFLGIGGGPLNMMILTGFYGMTHKEGALYSLFIIVFSQTAGILTALISGSTLPALLMIFIACAAGISGGVIGRKIAGLTKNDFVRTLYNIAVVFILLLCAMNIITTV